MKIAVIGDIHANHTALKACLNWIDTNDIDRLIFLGDYVTDCPYPQKTIDMLRGLPQKYQPLFIRGNREDYIINYRKDPVGWRNNSRTGALLYTYDNLSESALDWLEKMPDALTTEIYGSTFYLCHCPKYYVKRQKMPPPQTLNTMIDNMTTDVLLCAHSHVPVVYKRNGKLIVNSGTLGVAIDGITDAQFALLTYDNGWDAEIISLKYDIEAACAEFEESGLIERSGLWGIAVREMLRTGIEYSVDCADEVQRLLKNYPDKNENDEELWQLAAENIGLKLT